MDSRPAWPSGSHSPHFVSLLSGPWLGHGESPGETVRGYSAGVQMAGCKWVQMAGDLPGSVSLREKPFKVAFGKVSGAGTSHTPLHTACLSLTGF